MGDPEYFPEIVAACVDVMGMKNIIERDDKLDMAIRIPCQICANIANNQYDESGGLRYYQMQMGDAAYLISNPKYTISLQTQQLCYGLGSLISFGILGEKWIKYNFLLRGAIASGNLKTAKWEIENAHGNVLIGTSILRAFFLENMQNWIGASVLGNIKIDNPKKYYLLKYDYIPFDKDYLSKKQLDLLREWRKLGWIPRYAIDWVRVAIEKEGDFKLDERITKEYLFEKICRISEEIGKGNSKKIEKKIENTKRFIEYSMKVNYGI